MKSSKQSRGVGGRAEPLAWVLFPKAVGWGGVLGGGGRGDNLSMPVHRTQNSSPVPGWHGSQSACPAHLLPKLSGRFLLTQSGISFSRE